MAELTTDLEAGASRTSLGAAWAPEVGRPGAGHGLSRVRLDELLEVVADVVVILDVDGAIVYVSPAVRRLLALDPHALTGRPFATLLHPEADADTMAALLARPGPRDAGTRVVVRHGEEGWREVVAFVATAPRLAESGATALVIRDGQDRRHTLDALRHRLAFEDLLTRVASAFIHRPAHEIESGIGEALADIASFVGVDRAYVYVIDDGGRTIENTHAWDNPGLVRSAPRPLVVDLDAVPEWMATLRRLDPVYLPRVADLAPEWQTERLVLEPEGAQSVLVVPLADEGRLIGFIGFDSVTSERIWSDDHVAVLSSAAGIISQALARSAVEQRFGLAFSEAPLGMSLNGPSGAQVQVNRAYCELVGRSEEELLGVAALQNIHPDDRASVVSVWQHMVAGETDAITVDFRFVRPDGGSVWCRAHTAAVRSGDGSLRYMVSHFEDVTERRAADLELQASEERYRTLIENSPAVVTRFDREGRMVYMSPAFEQLGGMAVDDVIGRRADVFVGSDQHRAWFDALQRVITSGERLDTEWEVPVGERTLWFQSRAVPEFDDHGEVAFVLVMNTDITALKRTEAELAHQAMHDPLTGLANRSLLLDQLKGALARRTRRDEMVAVLFLDLDRFKLVNDSLGHTAGDALLVSIAQRLGVVLRPSDTVARLGGDEFVIVLEALEGPHEPIEVVDRIREALTQPVVIEGDEVFTTGSIGIAVATDAGATAEGLIRDADAAMYLAKARGRDRYEIFDEGLRRSATERLRLETQLRRAVELGELEVYYQPEVDLTTGALVGAEALARWHHPQQGLLEAWAFIELAEETGIILDLGAWVLDEACRQAGEWRRARPELPITVRVNLSARQIAQPDIVGTVIGALEAARLEPSSLCLEITETALMADAAAGLEVLEALRRLGVELAIDDFGTGYSSLAYLKRFPVGIVKIDRSFVDGLGTDPDDTAIATAIIGLARALNLRVVAEGVETHRQLAELRRLGCDRAQGFLFSRPVPSEAFWDIAHPFPVEGPRE